MAGFGGNRRREARRAAGLAVAAALAVASAACGDDGAPGAAPATDANSGAAASSPTGSTVGHPVAAPELEGDGAYGVDWLVPWEEGFLAIGSTPASGLVARSTADGSGWDREELALPPEMLGFDDVVSTGGRLVAVSTDWSAGDQHIVVGTTEDLTTWEVQSFGTTGSAADPGALRRSLLLRAFDADRSRWIMAVERATSVAWPELLPGELREQVLSGGASLSPGDAGITLTGTTDGDVTLTWDELGVDADVWDEVAASPVTEIWTGELGGVPSRADLDIEGAGAVAVHEVGFVVLAGEWFVSPDGADWDAVGVPADLVPAALIEHPDGLVVLSSSTDAAATSARRVDWTSPAWPEVEITGLPAGQFVAAVRRPEPAIAVVRGVEPEESADGDEWWLLAPDGDRWLAEELTGRPAAAGSPSQGRTLVARNGDHLLATVDGNWLHVALDG